MGHLPVLDQAWAPGSVFHLLQARLGLQPEAPNKRLFIDPELPAWLPDVALQGLKVGPGNVDLRAWREGDRTRWDAVPRQGDIAVQTRRWEPWLGEVKAT